MIESNYFIIKIVVGALFLFLWWRFSAAESYIHETECLKLLTEMEKLVRLVDYNLATTTAIQRQRKYNKKEGYQPWKLNVIICFIFNSEWIRTQCMCILQKHTSTRFHAIIIAAAMQFSSSWDNVRLSRLYIKFSLSLRDINMFIWRWRVKLQLCRCGLL